MRTRFLRFPEGKGKAVTLSYDDGCKTDLRLSDTITAHGLKCTFNINANPQLTDDELQAYVLDRGHEIAVHGEKHSAPGLLRPIEGIREMLNGRLALEKKFHTIIRGCAYPDTGITKFVNGASYESIRNYMQDLDIVYARTLGGDNNSFMLPTDFYAWMPTAHHTNPAVLDYIDEFLAVDLSANVYHTRRMPRLFYLWGHSFEFENDGNWELLDTICEKIGGKDDIWYATNMEIYAYIQAYNALVFSADSHLIYNPTLMTVWFDADSKLYCVHPGETIEAE